jgi:hypothetical protein
MKTLVDAGFLSKLIADHIRAMAGGRQSTWSYCMGYIRALQGSAGRQEADLKLPHSNRNLPTWQTALTLPGGVWLAASPTRSAT